MDIQTTTIDSPKDLDENGRADFEAETFKLTAPFGAPISEIVRDRWILHLCLSCGARRRCSGEYHEGCDGTVGIICEECR